MIGLKSGSPPDSQRALVAQPVPDVAPHDIGRSLKRGAIWAIGSQVAIQSVRLVGVVVLARLLTPDDYGLAALAVTLASFSMTLGDFGFGTALVQARTASQRWASTACWCCPWSGGDRIGTSLLWPPTPPRWLSASPRWPPSDRGWADLAPRRRRFRQQRASDKVDELRRDPGRQRVRVDDRNGLRGRCRFHRRWSLGSRASAAGPCLNHVRILRRSRALAPVPRVLADRLPLSREVRHAVHRCGRSLRVPGAHRRRYWSEISSGFTRSGSGISRWRSWSFPRSLLSAPLARVIYAAFARIRDDRERIAEVWLNGLMLVGGVVLPALVLLIAIAPDMIPLAFGAQWSSGCSCRPDSGCVLHVPSASNVEQLGPGCSRQATHRHDPQRMCADCPTAQHLVWERVRGRGRRRCLQSRCADLWRDPIVPAHDA